MWEEIGWTRPSLPKHPRKENDSFILYPTGSMNIICLF
jgi:hypothetical protein